jgi:hypothetical protein
VREQAGCQNIKAQKQARHKSKQGMIVIKRESKQGATIEKYNNIKVQL